MAYALEPDRLERYSRQIRFAPIGYDGQRRLLGSTVLIVGAGALGASLAQHMTRAGVGEIRLADRDYVELSNLQRQVLFDERDAEEMLPKAAAAAGKLRRINGDVRIMPHVTDVNASTIGPLIDGADLVLDGTDNAATRLLLSDECFRLGIPLLYGGVIGASGMCATLLPGRTACLRCLIGGEESEDGETCDTAGVISPAVDFVAALQSAEALKLLSGNEGNVRATWISADLWSFRLKEMKLPEGSGGCPHCSPARTRGREPEEAPNADPGKGKQRTLLHADSPVTLCGRDTVQLMLAGPVDLEALSRTLAGKGCRIASNPYLVRAELPQGERLVLFPDGRVLVQGTTDKELAVRLCGFYME